MMAFVGLLILSVAIGMNTEEWYGWVTLSVGLIVFALIDEISKKF